MGHIGYTPQFKKKFKIEGKLNRGEKLLKETKLIEKSGAFSIVLECLSPNCKINYKKTKYTNNRNWIIFLLRWANTSYR